MEHADSTHLTQREEELRWLREVYQGDRVRQLSFRSVLTGMLIGGVMSISNLYLGLQIGWSMGVTITSCIVAFAVFKTLESILPSVHNNPFTILENYTMSSASSAAAYMSSAGLVSAIPAMYMYGYENHEPYVLAPWKLMIWLAGVSALGVFMAIPLKRQLINIEKLPFPSGIATAETLRSLHSAGKESMRKARLLFVACGVGCAIGLWKSLDTLGELAARFSKEWGERITNWNLSNSLPFLPSKGATRLYERTGLGWEGSAVMLAAGAIMGVRAGLSTMLGSLLFYGLIGEVLIDYQIIPAEGFVQIRKWTLWPGTALLVASGLTSFALKWRSIVRAFSSAAKVFHRGPREEDPLAKVEVPTSWFIVGIGVSGAACVVSGHEFFNISYPIGVLAVLLSFVLSIVAARATGETDTTPVGPMGKITQLAFGPAQPHAAPGQVITPMTLVETNLMTACITAGSASHSADLLTDLKSGYLLGGNPRAQTISQLFGVLAGTLFCVPVFTIIAQPADLGSKFGAPAAVTWLGVAKIVTEGLSKLPPYTLHAMGVAAVIGILLALADEYVPRRIPRFWPSATGLGLAGAIEPATGISMAVGACIAWLLERRTKGSMEDFVIPVSSGLIAGQPLMEVGVKLCVKMPEVVSQIIHTS